MLASVAKVEGVKGVVSPFITVGAKRVSAGGRTAYATVVFTSDSREAAAQKLAKAAATSKLDVQVGIAAFTKISPGGRRGYRHPRGLGHPVAGIYRLRNRPHHPRPQIRPEPAQMKLRHIRAVRRPGGTGSAVRSSPGRAGLAASKGITVPSSVIVNPATSLPAKTQSPLCQALERRHAHRRAWTQRHWQMPAGYMNRR